MTAPPTSAAPVTASAGPRGGPLVQYALHSAGLVLVALAVTGALGALALPAARNTAMERS